MESVCIHRTFISLQAVVMELCMWVLPQTLLDVLGA